MQINLLSYSRLPDPIAKYIEDKNIPELETFIEEHKNDPQILYLILHHCVKRCSWSGGLGDAIDALIKYLYLLTSPFKLSLPPSNAQEPQS
jgi:hypothetical protein